MRVVSGSRQTIVAENSKGKFMAAIENDGKEGFCIVSFTDKDGYDTSNSMVMGEGLSEEEARLKLTIWEGE